MVSLVELLSLVGKGVFQYQLLICEPIPEQIGILGPGWSGMLGPCALEFCKAVIC